MGILRFDKSRPYVFVSYKSEDGASVKADIERLQNKHDVNIWFDEDLTPGRAWHEEAKLILADKNCKLVIFYASPKAIASKNVQQEINFANQWHIPFVPVNFFNMSFRTVLREKILASGEIDEGNANFSKPGAVDLIANWFPEELKFIYRGSADYFEELLKAVSRLAPDAVRAVNKASTKKNAPRKTAWQNGGESGNTSGNIVNGGYAAYKNGWLYYCGNDGRLYKIREDGKGRARLTEERGALINLSGGYIYYVCSENVPAVLFRKSLTDGGEREEVAEAGECVSIAGDWVYYVKADGNNGIYKTRAGKSGCEKLTDDACACVSADGDLLYYSNGSDGKKLYRINADGTGRMKLNEDESLFVNISEGFAYYSNGSDGKRLYKIRLDGTGRTKLNDDESLFVNAHKGYVYYSNIGDGKRLYRIGDDGTGRTRLNGDESGFINTAGGYIYGLSKQTHHLFNVSRFRQWHFMLNIWRDNYATE
jgi:hypothetical protein